MLDILICIYGSQWNMYIFLIECYHSVSPVWILIKYLVWDKIVDFLLTSVSSVYIDSVYVCCVSEVDAPRSVIHHIGMCAAAIGVIWVTTTVHSTRSGPSVDCESLPCWLPQRQVGRQSLYCLYVNKRCVQMVTRRQHHQLDIRHKSCEIVRGIIYSANKDYLW